MRRHRAFAPQGFTLVDAEAVLLVDHDETQVEELDGLAQECMSANDDVRLARDGGERRLPAVRDRELPRDERRPQPCGEIRAERRDDRAQVLPGEHLGGSKERRLAPAVGDGQHRPERDDGLARADLPLQQPVHG